MRKPERPNSGASVRCAIYTRKSSEDGLVQEFNSLDAQREACEAYIVSQRHAGWVALPDMYDDGGLSGGTMERPALKRLLEDVKASRVQIIVVYKVDRLTRSLADFAKIVDVLDAHNASFGQPLSHESAINSGADAVSEAQGNMIGLAIAKCPIGPAWPETLACADDNLIWMRS